VINDLWYKNAIIYSLSVGTYMDANGDGIGDFIGLTRRLDYLQGLGITAIWLMPFQVSPGRDDGYDVADYYGVDPRYGTLGDFVEFTHAAGQRGIRVLIDLVVNHTSNEHAWFKEARKDPHSKYRDWYIWSKRKPANASVGMVFPGVQKSTWSFDEQPPKRGGQRRQGRYRARRSKARKSAAAELQSDGAQAERVGDDEDRAHAHRGARDHGIEQQTERRIKHAGRDRHCERIEHEREEQILPDVAHGGPA
jgi:hypothetical protein